MSEPLSAAAATLGLVARHPPHRLRRIAVADDVVEPIMFLLGPDSRYMTGRTLWVNGGAYKP